MGNLKRRKIELLIIAVILSLLLLFILLRQCSLKKNGVLSNGRTIGWIKGSGVSTEMEYEFYYRGKKIRTSGPVNSKIVAYDEFINRYFPVMYDPKLSTSEILMTPSDFDQFGISFPDSLNWVLKYCEEK